LVLSSSSSDVKPALDLVTRNFGVNAASIFSLELKPGADCVVVGGEKAKAPCFSLSQQGGKVSIVASSMSELTYGIGHYTRYTCGLTVGRDKWGGSHTDSAKWPCTDTLTAVAVARAVK
jgi:hypothetical protein